MSGDRLYQQINLAGVASIPTITDSTPPPVPGRRRPSTAAQQTEHGDHRGGRTWLEAATAIPDRRPRPNREVPPARARIYRTPANPHDDLLPCWHWRCDPCGEQSNGCPHAVIHEPGTWPAALCGGLLHVHREHPRPFPPDVMPHTQMFHRLRCDVDPPSIMQVHLARRVIAREPGLPSGDQAREFTREVLALAGIRL